MKDLKATLGVGLCDAEDIDDCIVYVDLLKDAVFKLPRLNPDGTITVELRKYFLLSYLLKFAFKKFDNKFYIFDHQFHRTSQHLPSQVTLFHSMSASTPLYSFL